MAGIGDSDEVIEAVGIPVPSTTRYAEVRKHDHGQQKLEKKLMTEQELRQKYNRSAFEDYLRSNETQFAPECNAEEIQIRQDVETAAGSLTSFLRKRFRMFENCRLIKAGSSYEGFKLGPPDEFDFMLEIPAITNNVLNIHVPQLGNLPYIAKVNDQNFFSDICPDVSSYFVIDFWVNLKKIVFGHLKENLGCKKGWEVFEDIEKEEMVHGFSFLSGTRKSVEYKLPEDMKNLSWVAEKHAAITLGMTWRGTKYRKLDMSVDFCMAVPMFVNKSNYLDLYHIEEATKIPEHIKTSQFMRCHVLLLTKFLCRISFSVEEMRMVKQYVYPSGQNRCMRLLKYLRDAVILSIKDENGDPLHKFPSYWIKTTLYVLYQRYPTANYWEKDELGIRTLQALDVLADAFVRQDLRNFFIPSWNILESKQQNFQALVPEIRKLQQKFMYS